MRKIKLMMTGLTLVGLLAMACGGGDDDGDSSSAGGNDNVVIAAADADRVAHAGLPTVDDIPGGDWLVIAQDDFDSSGGDDFLTFIQGNPDCEALENLATLESVFGGGEDDEPPVGQAQVEIEQQDPDSLVPTSLDVEIEIDASAAGSRAEFALVKDLFESDETSNCIISVLNSQFSETGPAGVRIEVKKGSGSASAPQNGARMAFDIDMSFAGIELEMAMQMYFWPYGNATVQVLFLGTNEALDRDLVGGVLKAIDENLRAAAAE